MIRSRSASSSVSHAAISSSVRPQPSQRPALRVDHPDADAGPQGDHAKATASAVSAAERGDLLGGAERVAGMAADHAEREGAEAERGEALAAAGVTKAAIGPAAQALPPRRR